MLPISREIRLTIPNEIVFFIENNICKDFAPFCQTVLCEMLENFIVQVKEQKKALDEKKAKGEGKDEGK